MALPLPFPDDDDPRGGVNSVKSYYIPFLCISTRSYLRL